MAPEKPVSNGSRAASPPIKTSSSPPQTGAESKTENEVKKEDQANSNATRSLAPPPRPSDISQRGSSGGGDYFSQIHEHPPAPASNLIFEPNPFESSFSGQVTTAGGDVATPGGTKLPSVAALTSPASLLPGGTGMTPFWGGGSLRSGPLSPAMLAGPAGGDYFSEGHGFRGSYGSGITPNESSIRTGLTPGGTGSMFPTVNTPNGQALFQLANGGATPGTLDFHRTAVNAAAMQKQNNSQPQQQNITSQPQSNGISNGNSDRLSHQHPDPFSHGDANDAAMGLFSLAQSQNGQRDGQAPNGYVVAQQPPVHSQQGDNSDGSPKMRTRNQNGSIGGGVAQRGGSIGSNAPSEESEQQQQARPNTRGRGKRGAAAQTNGRRKAEEAPNKGPANKRTKANNGTAISHMEPEPQSEEEQEQDITKEEYNSNGKKMTDDEKRKNFLERNRVAALKCRQRKKQWLANLQHKVEVFANENESLNHQILGMRDEIVQLKTLLLGHKDCNLSQAQGIHMESWLGGMPHGGYIDGPGALPEQGMYPPGHPQQQQQLPNGGEMDRRFS